jgi:hypothetical protein
MTELLLIVGGSVFGVLGLLHTMYTFADARRPRRLAPDDPAVLESMRSSSLRLSRGGTTWRLPGSCIDARAAGRLSDPCTPLDQQLPEHTAVTVRFVFAVATHRKIRPVRQRRQ